MDNDLTLTIDSPEQGVLELRIATALGREIAHEIVRYEGPVDNLLLTTVDNLFNRNTLDRFALKSVAPGQGIDKDSSLYRIVQSFASAVAEAHRRP